MSNEVRRDWERMGTVCCVCYLDAVNNAEINCCCFCLCSGFYLKEYRGPVAVTDVGSNSSGWACGRKDSKSVLQALLLLLLFGMRLLLPEQSSPSSESYIPAC